MAKKDATRRLHDSQLLLARAYLQESCWPTQDRPRRPSVDDVATHLGISRRQLQRVFNDAGTTFTAEVHKAVTERAERMLLAGTTPVSQIARAAGYRHAGHFAKIFKEHRKASPARLRRRRLGRRARRIGGLRGTALFAGRLTPAQLRVREQAARAELNVIEQRLEREVAAHAAPKAAPEAFGLYYWPELVASILARDLGRLHADVEALDRRAWRERTPAGRDRRAALLTQIQELIVRIEDFQKEAARGGRPKSSSAPDK